MEINKLAIAISLAGLGLANTAYALDPWVGTADYTKAPTTNGDEESVGPFMTYNFGQGFVLIEVNQDLGAPGLSIGDTFKGYYQTYVNDHIGEDGSGVVAPNLNRFGTGGGYELTFVTTFESHVDSIQPLSGGRTRFNFVFDSGTSALHFDTTPDYSFTGDTGFSDGDILLSGAITEGSSTLDLRTTGTGTGFADLSIEFTGAGSFADNTVFDPDVAGALALFTLRANTPAQVAATGVTSVLGNPVNLSQGDQLLAATGDLQLLAAPVPVPAAFYLFGSALAGAGVFGRRRTK